MSDPRTARDEAIEVMAQAMRWIPTLHGTAEAALDALLSESRVNCETCGGATRWQCSGCRRRFNGPLRKVCPSCNREGYWSGSVEPCPAEGCVDGFVTRPPVAILRADIEEVGWLGPLYRIRESS